MRKTTTYPPSNEALPGERSLSLAATFRSLRSRNYLLWFTGQSVSMVGTWMQNMAYQLLVYQLTGSAAALGFVNFIVLIPLLPLTLWGGSLSDRISRRKIIFVTNAVLLFQAMALAVLTWTGAIRLWHVYVLALIMGGANAIDIPTRQAFTVDIVEKKEDLGNAIALNSSIFNGSRALGPAIAGLVVAATGIGTAFFLNGLSFLAVIACLLLMRNLPEPAYLKKEKTSTAGHVAGGFRFIFKERVVLVLMSVVAVSGFLSMPYATLMPVFADQVLADSAQPVVAALCGSGRLLQCQTPEALPLGMLLTMVGIGSVIGALVVATLSDHVSRGKMLTAGNIAFPLFLIFFAFSRSFVLSLAIMFMVGFTFVWQNALANTILQLITPDEFRGRVMSLYVSIVQGMQRVGGLQAGLVSDWISPQLSVGIGAAVSLVYGMLVAVGFPRLRRM